MEEDAAKDGIVLANVEDVARVCLARIRNVVLQVNHAFRPPC